MFEKKYFSEKGDGFNKMAVIPRDWFKIRYISFNSMKEM